MTDKKFLSMVSKDSEIDLPDDIEVQNKNDKDIKLTQSQISEIDLPRESNFKSAKNYSKEGSSNVPTAESKNQ